MKAKFRRPWLRVFLMLFPLCMVHTLQAQKPNILVFLVDDLGYGDAGFLGSKEIFTPNLDALAKGGVICDRGYATHPYCGPSRAGLMTGRHQTRFGIDVNLSYSPHDMNMGLPLEEKTLGNYMKSAGYRTAAIGKWHLGAAPPYHPNNRGFDHFYGFLSGGHSYFPSLVDSRKPIVLEDGVSPSYEVNEAGYLPLERNGKSGEFNEYLTTALSREAAEYVTKVKGPFCLYLAYNAPHGPLEAPKETIAKYSHIENPERRTYAAMIDELDRGIGMVVQALKDSGQFENTLIFFLGDNGGVTPKKGHANENWANNGALRRGKGSLHDGGVRVPFLIHWPKGLPQGIRYDGLVSSLDIVATAVALAEAPSANKALDGINLIPVLNGEVNAKDRALFWRLADGYAWGVVTQKHKYLKESNQYMTDEPIEGERAIYDLSQDQSERSNLFQSSPELRQSLAQLWNDWNRDNKANIHLESWEYQKERQKLYNQLYQNLKNKADRKKAITVD